MARIRTIKPEFPQSESMGRVSRDARLLFVLLWPICDDTGRTRAASRMLASLLFPYDDDAKDLIDGWLSELESQGCLRLYEVDGNRYLQIGNWLEHQKIDKVSKSKFPAPPGDTREDYARAREGSGLDQGPRTKEGTKDRAADAPLEGFEDFWKIYPKQEAEQQARAAYRLALPFAAPTAILAGARRYAAAVKRDKTEPKFVKSPAGWLADRRWTDGAGTGPPAASAFNSPEEQEAQRRLMEQHYGQA